MKVFIDTNIILDAVLSRKPFNNVAEQIILLSAKEQIDSFITANSITDIYYFVFKSTRNSDKAKEILRVLFTTFNISAIGIDDLNNALELPMKDFEDALLSCCAKRSKADYIITRNVKDFVNSPIVAILPEDFIKKIFIQ
jgi:predicted nucleic acid-binding protein